MPSNEIAFTTDSYVVSPPFFPGGDIGKLAICGTVNDLAVCGARPEFLSCGMILEEGFPTDQLKSVVESMRKAAEAAGVKIVTGDTKVVGKGKGDGIFINTAGVGPIVYPHLNPDAIKPGDRIILSGTLGDHGMAVLKARGGFPLEYEIESDCAPLNSLIESFLTDTCEVRFMRDPTRGGLCASLCELTTDRRWGIRLDEDQIPVRKEVAGLCEILGYDPLSIANEGKVIVIASKRTAPEILDKIRQHSFGQEAAIIGEIVGDHSGKVCLQTMVGGLRVLDIPLGEDLPRIC